MDIITERFIVDYRRHVASMLQERDKSTYKHDKPTAAGKEVEGAVSDDGALKYVKKVHGKYALVSRHTGRPLKYFDKKPSEEEADKALKAVEFFKHESETIGYDPVLDEEADAKFLRPVIAEAESRSWREAVKCRDEAEQKMIAYREKHPRSEATDAEKDEYRKLEHEYDAAKAKERELYARHKAGEEH